MNFLWISKIKFKIKPFKNWRGLLVANLLLVSIGIVFFVFGRKELELEIFEPEVIEPYEVRLESLVSLNSDKLEYLSVKRGGKLDRLFFKVGDEIKQGQILAVVDQTVHRSSVEAALSAWKLSLAELSRVRKLAASSSATQAELDIAQNQNTTKRAELEQAKQRLEDGIIRATKDGVLKETVFKEGDYISDGSRILAVEAKGRIKIHFEIQHDQFDLLNKAEAMDFWCSSDQKDRITTKDFKILSPDISQQLASSRLEINAELENFPNQFIMKNACKVSVLLTRVDRVYRVSFDKIYFEDGKPHLLTLDDSKQVHKRSINIVDTKIESLFVTVDKSPSEKVVTILDKNLIGKNTFKNLNKFRIKIRM